MVKPKAADKNVYLRHIEYDGWNSMHLHHIENQVVWRNLAILAIILLAITALYATYVVNQDRHKIIVLERDSTGNLLTLGLATKTLKVDNKMVAHQLINFITSLREVPQDIAVRRRNINLVHKMITARLGKQIDQMIVGQYSKNKIIMVTVKSIRPMQGGNSWQIAWHERAEDNQSHNLEKTAGFSSIISFKRVDDIALDVQLINPTGLFITYIHPVQDINP